MNPNPNPALTTANAAQVAVVLKRADAAEYRLQLALADAEHEREWAAKQMEDSKAQLDDVQYQLQVRSYTERTRLLSIDSRG